MSQSDQKLNVRFDHWNEQSCPNFAWIVIRTSRVDPVKVFWSSGRQSSASLKLDVRMSSEKLFAPHSEFLTMIGSESSAHWKLLTIDNFFSSRRMSAKKRLAAYSRRTTEKVSCDPQSHRLQLDQWRINKLSRRQWSVGFGSVVPSTRLWKS